MLKATNLLYKIKTKTILNLQNCSCTFPTGQITSILGPNGAGKSTLLKCLTKNLKPNEGKIFFNDKNLQQIPLPELAQKRAVLSQTNYIDFPFSVFDIIMMGRDPYFQSCSKTENKKIIQECINLIGIQNLCDRQINTLSGGEQQKVHIARTLAQVYNRQDICIFFDEPLNNLDLKHQYALLELLTNLKEKFNWAIVLILHDLRLAKHYSDKVIMLKGGNLLFQGETDRVLTPSNIAQTFDIETKLIKQNIFT